MIDEITKASATLQKGGIILFPSDTLWSVGCDPNNKAAVAKVHELVNGKDANNKIVLVASESQLQRYVKEIPEVCYDLLDYADKPLTIVYPHGQYVVPSILQKDGSIGIMMCKQPFCVGVLRKTRAGIYALPASTSDVLPKILKDVAPNIMNSVDYVVNLPQEKGTGELSQIIKIGANSEVAIIRK